MNEPVSAPVSEAPASTLAPAESPKQAPKALSFQDLDNLIDSGDMTLETEEPRKKAPVVEDSDDGDDDDVILDDDDLSDVEDDEEDSEEEAEAGDEEDSEDDEALDSPFDLAAIKGEFDAEGKVSVKINGEIKKLSFQEMKNLVSSGWHTKERYQTFQSEKAQWDETLNKSRAELSLANTKITPVWEKIKKGDIEGSVLELAKAKGLNSLDVRRHLREQMLPVVAERLGLPPEQVKELLERNKARNQFLDVHEENEFYKQETLRHKEEQEKAAKPDPSREAVEKFRALQVEHGVSNSDLQWAVGYQRKVTPEGTEPDLRGDSLIKLVLQKRRCDTAIEAIISVRPKLVKDATFVDRVVKKCVDNPGWQTSQVARWVYKQARKMSDPSKKSESLAKDISKKALQGKSKASFENPNASQKRPMKFSDLEEGDSLS